MLVYDDDDKQVGELSYYLSCDQRYLKYKQLKTLKSNSNFPFIPTILFTNIKRVQFCFNDDKAENKLPIGFIIKFKDENDAEITHQIRMLAIDKNASKPWLISFQKALKLLYETRDSNQMF